MCRSKDGGGMGFRELSKFNYSLLAKQLWHLEKNEKIAFSIKYSRLSFSLIAQ